MSNSNTKPALPTSVASTVTEPASRALGRLSAAAIITSLLIMVAAGLLRGSWMPPALRLPAFGPPWQLDLHLSARIVMVTLWVSAVIAGAGVAAGLVAVRRGQPVPMRTILTAALLAVAILVVVPPVGSTDLLDYAIYGHIVVTGHNPYVMTPGQYQAMFHLHNGVPLDWLRHPSVYGPLATAEQLMAARLGGASLAAATFWLKLVNAAAFLGVALIADRILRADSAARARAHLLWTANPLLIWSLIAGGHLDVLAAGVGLVGLLLADRWAARSPQLVAGVAAGLCVGAAAAIKASYLLFGLAVAWALRRRPSQLVAAAAGALAVLVPGYLIAGRHAVAAIASRASEGSGYGFYGVFLHHLGLNLKYAEPIAVFLLIPVTWLAVTRLPGEAGERQAVRAALALSMAWLLLWPHQFAWYTVMIICVLVFYPASRLDWLALGWLTAITVADLPGLGIGRAAYKELGPTLNAIQKQNGEHLAPLVMLVAAIALVVLCINGRWNMRQEGRLGG